MLTDTHKEKTVKAVEAYIHKKNRGDPHKTSQYRVLFTDDSYLMIQACGCCQSPWLDDNADLGLTANEYKWVQV